MSLRGAQRRSNPGQATHEPSEHHATTTCHCEERSDEATPVKQPTNRPSTTRPPHVIARSAATKQPRSSDPQPPDVIARSEATKQSPSSDPRTIQAPRDRGLPGRRAPHNDSSAVLRMTACKETPP